VYALIISISLRPTTGFDTNPDGGMPRHSSKISTSFYTMINA
jgi:hypothetical protein